MPGIFPDFQGWLGRVKANARLYVIVKMPRPGQQGNPLCVMWNPA